MPTDGDNGAGVVQDTQKHIIEIPPTFNYIGVFLTFACQLKCPYCINHENGRQPAYAMLTGAAWVAALNRIHTRPDLPITLQGGEPSLHPDFYKIILGIREDIPIDILTNCQFDVEEFARCLPPSKLTRSAPYASIRVSFHPPTMDIEDTIERVKYLQDKGFSIGVWIVDHPADKFIRWYQKAFRQEGIDCRLKEYLDGRDHGTYKYLGYQGRQNLRCRPSELLLAPNGDIHRCHGDLYGNRSPIANILQDGVRLTDEFRPCAKVDCTSCDIKIKTNRFQISGHCAVEIRENDTAK